MMQLPILSLRFHNKMNTLSVPTIHTIFCVLLFSLTLPVHAGEQYHQASVTDVSWKATVKKNKDCSLQHAIPLYGKATFSQSAGGSLRFALAVQQKSSRNKDIGHLRAEPPEWKHQTPIVDLGKIRIVKGEKPFQLGKAQSGRMLAELEKGMTITFSYRDWSDARDRVKVSLLSLHIKPALDKFTKCLATLPVYRFEDYQFSHFYFDFGKHKLKRKDFKRLDAVVKYLKSETMVSHIDIAGFTDNIGKDHKNERLGRLRSQAVKNYLVSKGISPKLFELKTFGERKPRTSNKTDQGRAQNRRAQLTLYQDLKKDHHVDNDDSHFEDNEHHDEHTRHH
jgi:sodium-type flagellar protein MotY